MTQNAETAKQPTEDLGLSEIIVEISATDYVIVWAFGLMICLVSTALAAYPIMKNETQKHFITNELGGTK